MDDVVDENAQKYTIRVYMKLGEEVFNGCTEVESDNDHLEFIDKNDKRHEFYGVAYHIQQE